MISGTWSCSIVVDASALLEVLLRTPEAAVIERRLFSPGQSLHAPHLLDIEVTQVMRRRVALGQIGQEPAAAAIGILADLPIHRHPHHFLLGRVWALRHKFSAYDAVYVALAESLDEPLITHDKRVANAAGHQAVIELV